MLHVFCSNKVNIGMVLLCASNFFSVYWMIAIICLEYLIKLNVLQQKTTKMGWLKKCKHFSVTTCDGTCSKCKLSIQNYP